MAPQGHNAGATSQEGACENSNLQRQGCSPFYQDVTDDPFVDPVSGWRAVGLLAHYFLLPFYIPVLISPFFIYFRTPFEITPKNTRVDF